MAITALLGAISHNIHGDQSQIIQLIVLKTNSNSAPLWQA